MAAASGEELERALLKALDDAGAAGAAEGAGLDSGALMTTLPPSTGAGDATRMVGTIKRLESFELVTAQLAEHARWELNADAREYLANGTPESRLIKAVPAGGIVLEELKAAVGPVPADIGFKQCMAMKLVRLEKAGAITTVFPTAAVASFDDAVLGQLKALDAGQTLPEADLQNLSKKRKLLDRVTWKTYVLRRGPRFALQLVKPAAELGSEMLKDGAWKRVVFKEYNFAPGAGAPPSGGHLHPLLKVRSAFRNIFISLGFAEMDTSNFVESSFWNFDTLIQPQQHPARDAHDTFFMSAPARMLSAPEDYVTRVKEMHENGGHGSCGYRYAWRRAEADKNILRTHTTAVSARLLYKLAQQCKAGQPWKPVKAFSVDRVFRNEALDRTHLAEFHQVEGLIADRGLTLGHLIGTLHQFFRRLGMTQLRFKPAYNPYTEPSMEIFAFHPMLNKWVEVGNSGMFRPEMLRPMGITGECGIPENVNVIAWGLSLERPTMILYGVDNIRDLFGTKVNLSMIRANPICRLGLEEPAEAAEA